MRWGVSLAILLLLSTSACQAQKSTVDPNTGPAVNAVKDDANDARLAQRVSYEAWHVPVKTILAELSKSTGVSLYAGYGKQDWQVRDRKMNVYVHDITLAQLMNSVARVMKFKWSRGEGMTPPTYRLVADRRLLGKLQAESSKREAELKSEEVKRRTALVQALARVSKASRDDVEKLKQTDPYLYLCASTGMAKMVTQMFDDMPTLRDAFVGANQAVIVGAGQFPAATQQLIASTIRGFSSIDKRKIPGNLEQRMSEVGVHFDCVPKPFESSAEKRLSRFGSLDANIAGGDHYIGSLYNLGSESAQLCGKVETSITEDPNGTQRSDPGQSTNAMLKAAKEMEYYLMFDPEEEHSKDEPGLDKKLELRVSGEDSNTMWTAFVKSGPAAYSRLLYEQLLKVIARAAKLNLVSDSYSVIVGECGQPADGTLGEVLGRLADTYKVNWSIHDSTLEVTRRDWFRRRSSQIPDEWLTPWRDQLRQNGMLTLDSYMSIVALTDEQTEENINCDQLLDQAVGMWFSYCFNRGFARLYTQLSSDQREQLFAKQGLDVRMLGPGQRDIYAAMFSDRWHCSLDGAEFASPEAGNVVLTGRSSLNKDGSISYYFTATLNKRTGGIKKDGWTVRLVKITLPQNPANPKN